MQGMFDLILRGKKKDIERFRRESEIVDLPEHPSGLRDLSLDDESFSLNYEIAADDDIVKYSFAMDSSGNINGRDEWAEVISKAFPELELLLNITYLDYDNCGDVVYSAAGSTECSRNNWSQSGHTIEVDEDLDWEQIEEKLENLREQGLDCDYDDAMGAIFVKEDGWEWLNYTPEIGQMSTMMNKSDLVPSYRLWEGRILYRICQMADVTIQGSAFVLSGTFVHYNDDRDKIKALIVAKGGRCTASVSGKTNYLVLGSQGSFSEKKVEQAQALQENGKDIKIITEETLFKFLK